VPFWLNFFLQIFYQLLTVTFKNPSLLLTCKHTLILDILNKALFLSSRIFIQVSIQDGACQKISVTKSPSCLFLGRHQMIGWLRRSIFSLVGTHSPLNLLFAGTRRSPRMPSDSFSPTQATRPSGPGSTAGKNGGSCAKTTRKTGTRQFRKLRAIRMAWNRS
jgi:hypothetical protein